jgi:hypothetical protein
MPSLVSAVSRRRLRLPSTPVCLSEQACSPISLDLVVEALSPVGNQHNMRVKIANLAVGIKDYGRSQMQNGVGG